MQNLRSKIRNQVRKARNNLSSLDQTIAAEDVLSHIRQLPFIESAQNIAIYLSADGELDTHPIIEYFWQQGKNVYLPVLHPFSKGHLLFLEYRPDTPMVENKFNIQEPKLDQTKVMPIAMLDVVFTPLVAFDDQGQRLGMGGGYYDRSLAKWFRTGEGPLPVGIAHDCQQVERVPSESWDVPLPTLVSPGKIWNWSHPPLGK